MIKQQYEENIRRTEGNIQNLQNKINRFGGLRLAVFVGFIVFIFKATEIQSVLLLLLGLLALGVLFLYLVKKQSDIQQELSYQKALLRVNQNETFLAAGYGNIYGTGEEFSDDSHPYSADLDVFGKHSIYEALSRTSTANGKALLASWLSSPADTREVLDRQQVVEEWSQSVGFLQDLQAHLIFAEDLKVSPKQLLENYLSFDQAITLKSFLRFYIRLVPYLWIVLLGVSYFLYPIWSILGLLAAAHWTVCVLNGGKIFKTIGRVDKGSDLLKGFSKAAALLEGSSFQSKKSVQLIKKLQGESERDSFSGVLKELTGIVSKIEVRNNPLVGIGLNMLFLWDLKQSEQLSIWKRKHGEKVQDALEVIAEVEALLSLSLWRVNHPTWARPLIIEEPLRKSIRVRNMGHPLIDPSKVVVNSYDNHLHHIALITGSNMAGKSTFLRTFGTNAVLAFSGAVVCAESFHLPILALVSYMRIKDNLQENTSTFKAELDRMRFILAEVQKKDNAFFLIDEMFRGTNSVDKFLGSKAVIKKLLALHAQGMIATHDLQLSELEKDYPQLLENFHFDIQIVDGEMQFDYKVKHGKCTVFNASSLLKKLGIEIENN